MFFAPPKGNIMTDSKKRATIYLEPELHKALKIKSAETGTPMSDLVNTAIKSSLSEDAEDIAAFSERSGENLISYDDMVRMLQQDGHI